MSDPHSPRRSQNPDVPWRDETLHFVEPAASAEADAAWENAAWDALWDDLGRVLDGREVTRLMRHRSAIEAAARHSPVVGRRKFRTRPMKDGVRYDSRGEPIPGPTTEVALRSAGTPPASRITPCDWCGHADDQHGNADPECTVEGCRCVAYSAIDGDYGNLTEDQHRAIRAAPQASPPTGVSNGVALPLDADYEKMRMERGWPTPNHMRRTADALDSMTPAKYGDVLRWFADLADASLPPAREQADSEPTE